ncbi:Beige 1 [Fulvia fulva]|nr:Beige 1 [Fulvia fulva]
MALRAGQPASRMSSFSRGMNADEQSSDTASLIQQLGILQSTSDVDELSRLSDTAERLRHDLGSSSNASAKDTFRHGHGFEKTLQVLHELGTNPIAPMRNLLQLLTAALRHRGNDRYFSNHLHGWDSLGKIFNAFDSQEHVSSLLEGLLALAVDEIGDTASDPRHRTIVHARACECATRVVLGHKQPVEWLESLAALSETSTRNASALSRTNIAHDILHYLDTAAQDDTLRPTCTRLLLSVARYGLQSLDDVVGLFKSAAASDTAKETLLTLLRSSKEPAFIQFDLSLCGYSSIEFPRLPGAFPPSIGYSLTVWLKIDEFDPNAHTTIFGAFDANQGCFVMMYLEKDSHQLILQTSMRAPSPSIRFKSTHFEASTWYHIAIVQRKSPTEPNQSMASLFVDGNFAEQRKCHYPETPDESLERSNSQSASMPAAQRRFKPVQAFFGTPRSVASKPRPNEVTTKYSLGGSHLYQVPLTDEFVAVHHRLGPRYSGNFQDTLGPLLTYRASSELNRYNETLHPDRSDRSDIMIATEGRGSEVVPESRMLLGLSPSAHIDFDAPNINFGGHDVELDHKAQQKYQILAKQVRAVAVNTAVATLNEAVTRSYGTGLVMGDPVIVTSRPLDDATWRLCGSIPILLQQLESATSKKSFLQAVEILVECVRDNWRISEAMEKGNGFGMLALIIREKLGFEVASTPHASTRRPSPMIGFEDRQSLPAELLETILDFVGHSKSNPGESLLINPMAYRVLVVDFDTWRRCDLASQTIYWKQFVDFTSGNRHSAFNHKRLTKMRVVKRLIEALKSEDVTAESAPLMMTAMKALLDTTAAQSLYRDLAMFVAYSLQDNRAMHAMGVKSFASTVSLRQKMGSWARNGRGSRPSTPGGAPTSITKPALTQYEIAILTLKLVLEILGEERSSINAKRFNKAIPTRWLLHLFAETDVRVIELTLSLTCRALIALGSEFKINFADKNSGFTILKLRLKPFWRTTSIWMLSFAMLFGRNVPLDWLSQDFSAFHLVEMLSVDDSLAICHPEMLPVIFTMLEAGMRKVAKDEEKQDELEAHILKTVIQLLGELYDRSSAFRDFTITSKYLQELLFVLFPLLTGTDRLSAETELGSGSDALSFRGQQVRMRPHSNSLGERPPSVRSISPAKGRRTPSPMAANRVQVPRRISSFVLINDGGDRLAVPPAQFKAPMAPKSGGNLKINVTNSLVESLLELTITLFIDQICYRDKFSGIGLFLKVPPGFKEHQAYFESYVLVNALSQLGSHLRLNQRLLVETRVLTNLARYAQHMAEAVSEGWFIDGAQPLLDFTGEILEHLQAPDVASQKAVRLCSQSITMIRVVFLKATLWRLSELNEDANQKHVDEFLTKMTYWQTILFSAENQETLFTKLICYLLYHKLVSGVKSVRLAAARLWRTVLVQKPTETATMLTATMGPDQRHLSTGFMKLISMDDEDFLAWVDQTRSVLDNLFHKSLSKPWDDFVQSENRSAEDTTKHRLSKRRDKLKQWHNEESAADEVINKYETSTSHWRANVHAQERVKLQRALQDQQENVNHLYAAFSKIAVLLHQPCGLLPIEPSRWHLDETEAVNRMRLRIVPDTTEIKQEYQPKRKASRSVSNGAKLAIDTQISRNSDGTSFPMLAAPNTTHLDGANESVEQGTSGRPRSESVSNSQLLEGGFEMVDDPKEDEDGVVEDKNRKIMTSLQRNDQVQQLYNTSRIVGLEACEGLVVVGQKCFYMQDNFFQRSDGEIISVAQAPADERDPYVQLISGKDVGSSKTKHSIGDQETRHWTWAEVLSVSKRRFLLRDVAIEVFFTDGRSYLLTCMSSKVRDDLYSAIVQRAPHVHSTFGLASEDAWRLDTLRNPEEAPKNLGSKFNSLFNNGPANTAMKRWQRGEMSNFQYLMLINTMAGRTFNDLTQYPVFPWVLSDYSSEELDLDDSKSYRDFAKPMGCQSPMREAEYKDRYKQFAEMGDHNAPAFHYGTHYSSAMIVSSYLIRLQPFVQSYLLLQGGAFDHADRLFDSIEKAWLSASKDTMSDVRELTPEFFYLPEFLTNINKYDFGTKQVTGEAVNDVRLPQWAKGDPHIFIAKHRQALESPYVSEHLHDWIDLVFGFKQRGEAAIEATNVFQHLSYGGARDLDKIEDQVERLATIGIIHSFGQTPHQVFQKPHLWRELDKQADQRLDTLAETLTKLPDTVLNISEKVVDFTFSPTQNRLLTSGPCQLNVLPDCDRFMQWGFADHSVRFFSKHSKRLLGLHENSHVGPVTAATFVDSKTLITAGQDSTIGVWKVLTSRDLIELHPKTYLFGHRTAVTVLAASRVFSTLVSASADGQTLIWGLNRYNCIRILLSPGGPAIQAARISNSSGHILLCRGSKALLYTINGQLLVEQQLCDRDEDDILSCAFYEGANEYLERELIFTGHANGLTNIWTLTALSDGKWCLLLVKRMSHGDHFSAKNRSAPGITAVLPVAKAVYTGDEEGNVFSWETVVRHSGVSMRGR